MAVVSIMIAPEVEAMTKREKEKREIKKGK